MGEKLWLFLDTCSIFDQHLFKTFLSKFNSGHSFKHINNRSHMFDQDYYTTFSSLENLLKTGWSLKNRQKIELKR